MRAAPLAGRSAFQDSNKQTICDHFRNDPTTAGNPFEQANLVYWYDHQETKQRCHRRLARWIAKTGDSFEQPDIPWRALPAAGPRGSGGR